MHFPQSRVYRSVFLRDARILKIVIYDHERLENTSAPGVIFLSGQQLSLMSPGKQVALLVICADMSASH